MHFQTLPSPFGSGLRKFTLDPVVFKKITTVGSSAFQKNLQQLDHTFNFSGSSVNFLSPEPNGQALYAFKFLDNF